MLCRFTERIPYTILKLHRPHRSIRIRIPHHPAHFENPNGVLRWRQRKRLEYDIRLPFRLLLSDFRFNLFFSCRIHRFFDFRLRNRYHIDGDRRRLRFIGIKEQWTPIPV